MKSNSQKVITANPEMIAFCGLYCGSCGSFLKGKCPGCRESAKNTWCAIKKCCTENNFKTCADCNISAVRECKKYNSLISKVIGLVLNSDRAACIERIKEKGTDAFATEMATNRMQTIKRN